MLHRNWTTSPTCLRSISCSTSLRTGKMRSTESRSLFRQTFLSVSEALKALKRCCLQIPGDAAGVPAGLHRQGQTSAGPERALRQSADRLWEEVGQWELSGLARKSSKRLNVFGRKKKVYSDVGTFMMQKETSSALTHAGAHLDLSAFSSWEVQSCSAVWRWRRSCLICPSVCQELASLGLDRLKSALMALGLKCGGWVLLNSWLIFC